MKNRMAAWDTVVVWMRITPICLILGSSWWNCLGMVQRCGLVEEIMSLGDGFECLSTS